MKVQTLDLLPAEVRTRIQRGRLTRRLMFAAIGVTTLMLATVGAADWVHRHSARVLREARQTAAGAVAIEAEMRQLELQRKVANDLLEQQRSLAVTVPASGLIHAVSSALPAGSLLETIELKFLHIQGEPRKGRRAVRTERDPREMQGEIAGLAASDADVGTIVDALAKVAPISNVSLESSRSREFRGKSAREFRITFRVDLERRWRMPTLSADAASSMEGSR